MDSDVEKARYFSKMAQNNNPHIPSVSSLKDLLVDKEQTNFDKVIHKLQMAVENHPTDINLRLSLLKNLLQRNRISESYQHISNIEENNLFVFPKISMWYEVIADVCTRYKNQFSENLTWQFWFTFVSILDKVLGFTLDENSDNLKGSLQYVCQLFIFDQTLHEASQNLSDCPSKLLLNEFLNHYRGQLYFHFATTILKQAKTDLIEFKEAAAISLPLLFAAYDLKPPELKASWINQLVEPQQNFLQRWRLDGAFRCSQSGHILLAAAKDRKYVVKAKATQHSFGMWQERLFKRIFINQEQQLKMNSSFFVNNQIELDLLIPTAKELMQFDVESFHIIPDSLHHYIWVSMNNDLVELKYLPFQGLQYSVKNLSKCGAESLSLLDVESFIYCATLCAKAQLKDANQTLCYNIDRPEVLPESITEHLGSLEQQKFLTAVYKTCSNEYDSHVGEMRQILVQGLETMRCIGRHGIGVSLLVNLADIFSRKAEKLSKQSEVEFNNARAELFWKSALPSLEKLKTGQFVTHTTNRFFEYESEHMTLSEIHSEIDKGKLFLGTVALKRKEYDKALNMLAESKNPFASFNQAEAYKRMADHFFHGNKAKITIEMKNEGLVLITKARDCLYLTLERLRHPSVARDHPLNSQLVTEIDKLEKLLVKLHSEDNNRNECDGISDDTVSSDDGEENYTLAENTINFLNISNPECLAERNTKNIQSTPLRLKWSKREDKPTPERLDARLRQLYVINDATTSQALEQNKIILESHRNLVDELRSFKEAVHELSAKVGGVGTVKSGLEELKDVRKSVDQLKSSVEELQSLKIVSDLVRELKQEVVEMRKDNTGSRPIKRDQYDVEDDYAGYAAGANARYNPSLYQNYPNRVPQVAPAQAGMYAHGFYPGVFGATAPYGYPSFGLSHPGLLYGPEHQPDLRTLPNPLFPTHPYGPAQLIPVPVQPPIDPSSSSSLNASLLTGQSFSKINTPPSLFETTLTTPSTVSISSLTNTKSAPVNVVITSSDPLPTLQSSASQPALSVTIPPQHIKGNLHQSQLTTATASSTSVFPNSASIVGSEGMMSNKLQVLSTDSKSSSKKLGMAVGESTKATTASISSPNSSPAFQFPPDDISPSEITLFERVATLFAFVKASNGFEVAGTGTIMILEDKDRDRSRILMKDERGKNIVNYYISVEFIVASGKDNSFYWHYLVYSDGNMTTEKFCLQFKSSVDADEFYEVYEQCKQKYNFADLARSALSKKTEQNKNSSTDGGENVFGDFVFKSTPSLTQKKNESVLFKPEASIQSENRSMFGDFSFGIGNNSNNTFEINTKPSILARMLSTPSEVVDPNTRDASKHTDSSLTDDFVPNAEFQPVIPLPDVVEVTTGEENAEVLFNCRAKLLRFDSDLKEWKERGLGNMKILREKWLIRLLMRSEQILKVCCNHQLLKRMNFQYMPNNCKALTWLAQDYADEVLRTETFALRFKTEEQAGDFLRCISLAQETLNDDNTLVNKKTALEEQMISKYSQGFGEIFTPYMESCGSKDYLGSNKNASDISWGIPVHPIGKLDQIPTPREKESRGIPGTVPKTEPIWGDAFKPKAGTWECECCLVRNDSDVFCCKSCQFPKNLSASKKKSTGVITGVTLETPFKFNFGIGADVTPSTTQEASSAYPSSSTSTVGFSFSHITFSGQSLPTSKSAPSGVSKETSESLAFEPKATHARDLESNPGKSTTTEGEIKCIRVEKADHMQIQKANVVDNGGQEFEKVLFRFRAKLAKFVDDEWKERGIGELQILRNQKNRDLRVSMREERVSKICLNHALTPHVEYRPKDVTTWTFSAADASEGQMRYGKFSLGFENTDVAKKFKEAVVKSLKLTQAEDQLLDSDYGSDIEFVMETSVTAEELREAQRLILPPKFFAYKQLPFCTCDQCAKDDEYFKGTLLDNSTPKESSVSTPTGKQSDCTTSSGSDVFLTPPSFNEVPKYETLRDLLAKPPLPTRGEITSTFCHTKTDTPISSSITTAGNLFGSKFGASANLFAAKPSPTDENTWKSFTFASKYRENSSAHPSVSSGSATSGKSIAGKNSSVFGGSDKTVTHLFGGTSTDPKKLFDTLQLGTKLFGNIATDSSPRNFNSNSLETSVVSAPPTTSDNNFGFPSPAITTAQPMIVSNTSTTSKIFRSSPIKSCNQDITPVSETNVSPFGPINTIRLFGSSNASLFGSGAKYEFGNVGSTLNQPKEDGKEIETLFTLGSQEEKPKTTDLKDDDDVILNCSDNISFSSLAQKNLTVSPSFQRAAEGGGDMKPFAFMGAGTPVFCSKKKQETDPQPYTSQEQGAEETADDEEYDPHYEPLIPMPEAIVVSTGEEEETAVFNERAKLFRYDPELKEWKERGVGQMKVLHHPENGTYRFLLRREQVHKIVLNQLITPTLNVQPMTTSDKACMWAGYNYVDEQMNLEKLAVRFKYQETSGKFLDVVQTCLSDLKDTKIVNLPSTIQNSGMGNVSSDSDPQDENSYQKDENDYSEDDDDTYDDVDDDYEEER